MIIIYQMFGWKLLLLSNLKNGASHGDFNLIIFQRVEPMLSRK